MATPEFRNISISCLSELAKKPLDSEYENRLSYMFTSFITQLLNVIPLNTAIAKTYEDASDDGLELVLNTTLFLTHFLTNHIVIVENAQDITTRNAALDALRYLLQISLIDDREIFKICVEYWHLLLTSLYEETLMLPVEALNMDTPGELNESLFSSVSLRKDIYLPILSELRVVMIQRMVKPNEVRDTTV
jgi:exportin-1